MENSELLNNWFMGLVIVTLIVIIAATLLILIWLSARRILKITPIALKVVKEIQKNTNCIWELEKTNNIAGKIHLETEAISTHLNLVSESFDEVKFNQSV